MAGIMPVTRDNDAPAWWCDYPCSHDAAVCSLHGSCVMLVCQECRRQMMFFWEPRLNWFVARIGTEGTPRSLVHPSTVVKFIVKNALQVRVPDPPVSPESSDPRAAVERFSALSGILTKFGMFDSDIAVVKVNPRDTMHNA